MARTSTSPSILGQIISATWEFLKLGPVGSPSPSARRRRMDVRAGYRRSYVPHCGVRARARRVGGATWQEFRDMDRLHRGLDPM